MGNELQSLRNGEVRLLFKVCEKLFRSGNRDTLRKEIADDLLRLLHADFLASFIWNPDRRAFEHVVFQNMSPANIARYDDYYRFCDPITPLLQKRRRATLVREIMPQKELEKTEFFNDFLMADGLHHGINVYAYDGSLNIGDLRIWRARKRPRFGTREVALLNMVLPHFRNALRNARALSEAESRSGLWESLMEKIHKALFLFDQSGHLVYRNHRAREIELSLSKGAYEHFSTFIHSIADGNLSSTRWGPFFLSAVEVSPSEESPPYTAVMAHEEAPAATVDREFLRLKQGLSPREAEISLLVCKGLTDQEIASALGISFSTVRTHLKHVFAKLDVTTRSELIFVLMEDVANISF